MSEERCETCRWFKQFHTAGGSDGYCRKEPPVLTAPKQSGDSDSWSCPVVEYDWLCSHWMSRNQLTPAEDAASQRAVLEAKDRAWALIASQELQRMKEGGEF